MTEVNQQNPARKSVPSASRCSAPAENISSMEKVLSIAAGGALLCYALKRAAAPGVISLLAGGALLYRGYTGYCGTYDLLGIDTTEDVPSSSQSCSLPLQKSLQKKKPVTTAIPNVR